MAAMHSKDKHTTVEPKTVTHPSGLGGSQSGMMRIPMQRLQQPFSLGQPRQRRPHDNAAVASVPSDADHLLSPQTTTVGSPAPTAAPRQPHSNSGVFNADCTASLGGPRRPYTPPATTALATTAVAADPAPTTSGGGLRTTMPAPAAARARLRVCSLREPTAVASALPLVGTPPCCPTGEDVTPATTHQRRPPRCPRLLRPLPAAAAATTPCGPQQAPHESATPAAAA